jgi:hypothetical protein
LGWCRSVAESSGEQQTAFVLVRVLCREQVEQRDGSAELVLEAPDDLEQALEHVIRDALWATRIRAFGPMKTARTRVA